MKNYTTLIFISLFLSAYSQSSSIQFHSGLIIGQVRVHKLFDIDNDLLVFGEYETSVVIGDSTFNRPFDRYFLTRLNSQRQLIWFSSFGGDGTINPSAVRVNNNGSIYIGGYFTDSLWFGTHSQYSSNGSLFIWQINAKGNLRSSSTLTGQVFVRDLIPNNANMYALLSARDSLQLNQNIILRASKPRNTIGALVEFDSSSNYINHHEFETSKAGYLSSGAVYNDELLLTSTRGSKDTIYFNNNTITHNSTKAGGDIFKLDNNISILKHSYFETDTNKSTFLSIHDWKNTNNVIFSGQFTSHFTFDSLNINHSSYPQNQFSLSDGLAFAINDNLSPNWLLSLSSSIANNISIRDGIFLNDEIILVGTASRGIIRINLSDSITSVPIGTESIILFLDTLGHFKKFSVSMNTGSIPETRLNSIIQHGNGFAVAGHTNHEVSFTNSTDTLFRRSSRVGFIWFFDSYLDLEKFQSRQQALSLYPNPSRHWVELKIELAQAEELLVEMLSLEGKVQGQRQHFSAQGQSGENILRYSTAHLAPGLYLLRVRNQQGAVLGHEKLVVQ